MTWHVEEKGPVGDCAGWPTCHSMMWFSPAAEAGSPRWVCRAGGRHVVVLPISIYSLQE